MTAPRVSISGARLRWPLATALAVCLAVLAVACTSPPAGSDGQPGPPAGVLRMAVARPVVLDPAATVPGSAASAAVSDLLFDGLTALDPQTSLARPALAASWRASADQRAWEFTLRDGAGFHDGTPVTAADVVASLERAVRLAGGTPAGAALAAVEGYDAFAAGETPTLAGLRASGERTVRVVLRDPLAELPELLANPQFGVVPASLAAASTPTGSAIGDLPVGSGPFAFSQRDGDVIRLVRAPGSAAALDGAALMLYDSPEGAYAALLDGAADWAEVAPSELDEAIGRFGTASVHPYAGVFFYAFDVATGPTADARLREAVVAAVDRGAVLEGPYRGSLVPLGGVAPTGMPGGSAFVPSLAAAGNGDLPPPPPCGTRCAHDPQRSRTLVAEVYGGGPVPVVPVTYDDTPTQAVVAARIVADLQAVGIPAETRPVAAAEYQGSSLRRTGGLVRLGWVGAWPSAGAVLGPLFTSTSPDNVSGLADPDVDALMAAAAAEPDPAVRAQRWTAVDAALMDRWVVLPLGQYVTVAATSGRVQDLVVAADGTFDAEVVRVA